MTRKLLSLLVLLMTAATGAWAQVTLTVRPVTLEMTASWSTDETNLSASDLAGFSSVLEFDAINWDDVPVYEGMLMLIYDFDGSDDSKVKYVIYNGGSFYASLSQTISRAQLNSYIEDDNYSIYYTASSPATYNHNLYLVINEYDDTKTLLMFGNPNGNPYYDGYSCSEVPDDFKENCTKITVHWTCNSFDGKSLRNLFYGFEALKTINDIDELNTTNVKNMSYMFPGCVSLTSLDLSSFNTSNVKNMSYMFDVCGGLKTLTFGDNWDTSNVTDMTSMFAGCWELASLDLSSFETSKVTDMNNMFYGCESLTSLTLGNGWDTSKVTDMSFMFSYAGLTTLDLSNWDTSNVTNMRDMFEDCHDLTSLTLGDWDTSNVTDMSCMFNCCENLTSLNLGNGWDTSSLTDVEYMFENTGLSKSVTANEGETGEYWATFYDETTGYNYQAPEGTKVFKVALAGSTLTMTEIDDRIVNSDEGVVLKGTSGSISLNPTIFPADYSDNSLKGTTTSITNPGNAYVLNKKEAGIGFYKLSATGTIGANKAYLTYDGSGAREFFSLDETTGIEDINRETITNNRYYDLQGRRVENPTNGIYIVNGKKVVIK